MQLKFFTLPILGFLDDEEQINKFLRSVKPLEIKRELVKESDSAYWAICVLYLPIMNEYLSGGNMKGKTDYKEILNENEFKLFSRLRRIRKQIASEDAVPAFAVFTDQELSEISRLPDISVSSIKQIKGIGSKRMEKYGERFCQLIVTVDDE